MIHVVPVGLAINYIIEKINYLITLFFPYMQIMCNPSLYSFQQTTVLSWETVALRVHVINKAKDLIFYISFIQT